MIDARTFIQGVDREELTKQVAEAKANAAKAEGEYRSLISLMKMIDYRDGLRLRKSSKRKAAGGSPNQISGDVVDELDDGDSDEESMTDQISVYLGRRPDGTANIQEISRGVGAKIPEVKRVLESHQDLFQTGGMGIWSLVEEE
jgi:hypothetical protein